MGGCFCRPNRDCRYCEFSHWNVHQKHRARTEAAQKTSGLIRLCCDVKVFQLGKEFTTRGQSIRSTNALAWLLADVLSRREVSCRYVADRSQSTYELYSTNPPDVDNSRSDRSHDSSPVRPFYTSDLRSQPHSLKITRMFFSSSHHCIPVQRE